MSSATTGTATEELDAAVVRRRLERAGYPSPGPCFLHAEIGRRLAEHLEGIRIEPGRVLDASATPGSLAERLARRYRRAALVAVEPAQAPLRGLRRAGRWRWRARPRHVCARAERLPLAPGSIDLVAANLSLHRLVLPDPVLREYHRVLAAGGLLMLSTFGPDTLAELRAAWREADGGDHVHPFPDMHDLGDALVRAGFADVVMSTERLTVHYPDLRRLHLDLRALGVTSAMPGRARGLLTPRRLARVERAYEALRAGEGLPVSVEVAYAHAWRPEPRGVSVRFPTSS